jgi:hypothetical protein
MGAGTSITIPYTTGATVKAMVINGSGEYWNTSGTPAFEAYNAANIADYGIACTEDGSSGNFRFTFPAGITNGTYTVQAYDLVGASLAESDARIASDNVGWDGSALIGTHDLLPSAVWALANAIDGKTPTEAMQIIGAATAGKLSGAGTGTEVIVGLDGLTTRITATLDGSGNRTSVVYS